MVVSSHFVASSCVILFTMSLYTILLCYYISICVVTIYHFTSWRSDCRIMIYLLMCCLIILNIFGFVEVLCRWFTRADSWWGIGRGCKRDGVAWWLDGRWRGSALALCLVRSLFLWLTSVSDCRVTFWPSYICFIYVYMVLPAVLLISLLVGLL